MNYLDIIICVPLIWGVYQGFKKGFIIQVASILALVLGIFSALKLSEIAEHYVRTKWQWDSNYLHVICFASIFVAVIVLVLLLGKLLETMVKIVALGIINRIAGAVFGFIKYAVIISVVLILINRVGLISNDTKETSKLYKSVTGIVGQDFRHHFTDHGG